MVPTTPDFHLRILIQRCSPVLTIHRITINARLGLITDTFQTPAEEKDTWLLRILS